MTKRQRMIKRWLDTNLPVRCYGNRAFVITSWRTIDIGSRRDYVIVRYPKAAKLMVGNETQVNAVT